MSKVALFFGSFNPVHLGHLHIAKTVINKKKADALWFIPSPQNPFKNKVDLIPFRHRKTMLNMATKNLSDSMEVCNIEESLPKPNYTVTTMKILKKKTSQLSFPHSHWRGHRKGFTEME